MKTKQSTLPSTFLPELGTRRQGKVRDIYETEHYLTLITSDRISVFDRVLNEAIPQKGQILNELSLFWFDKTKDIVPNHIVKSPDPNVVVVKKCEPILVEMIVRSYLTGSLWRDYQSGKRSKCGHILPEGLQQNQKLPELIVTPTTKSQSGHDEDITSDELIQQGIVSRELWKKMEQTALKLFQRGQEILHPKGIILVDTKYEFGLDNHGELILIDEIHTPDSSRFWVQKDVDRKELKFPDKEYVREYCRSQGFTGDGIIPTIPHEVIENIREGYSSVYEMITGAKLPPLASNVPHRLLRQLKDAQIIQGYCAVIFSGSDKDQAHVDKITQILNEHKIPHKSYIASAHKTPKAVLDLIEEYNQSLEPIVCITVAGRSNALSGMVAANIKWPVIACPPFKDYSDYLTNIHSSLQMPSNVPAMTVIDPQNAALATVKILKSMEL